MDPTVPEAGKDYREVVDWPLWFHLLFAAVVLFALWGAVQALVFALLAAVYLYMAQPHHDEDEHPAAEESGTGGASRSCLPCRSRAVRADLRDPGLRFFRFRLRRSSGPWCRSTAAGSRPAI